MKEKLFDMDKMAIDIILLYSIGYSEETRRFPPIMLDFRRINMVSLTNAEPMPNQEMVIRMLGASGYFTNIDLSKGYWQIPIKQKHRYLTAHVDIIVCGIGLGSCRSCSCLVLYEHKGSSVGSGWSN